MLLPSITIFLPDCTVLDVKCLSMWDKKIVMETGLAIFFVLQIQIQSSYQDVASEKENFRSSRSNVAYFNAKIHQVQLPFLLMNKNESIIESHSDSFAHLLHPEPMQWMEWSFCSRSCGGGVKMRSRNCGIRMDSSYTNICDDDVVQYKTCNSIPCPMQSMDSRSVQCSQYNHRPVFPNARFKWIPHYDSKIEPCHLTCKAAGFDLYKTFGLVQDGTLCYRDKSDVCIDGKCMKVGCDQIVGSNLTNDACGICDGDNIGCFHFESNYTQAPNNAVRFNYYEIAMIPTGATHLKVEEKSGNILALMEAEGKFVKYVLNGNWVMRRPGSFTAAGTLLKYRNNNDDAEVLEGKGPTTMDLHIMVLYLEDQPLVEYEYWLPTKQIEEAFHNSFDMRDENPTGKMEEKNENKTIAEPSYVPTNQLLESSVTSSITPTSTTFSPQLFGSPPLALAYKANRTSSRQRSQTKQPGKSSLCHSCKRPRNRRKHFCSSNFVVRARITSKTKMKGKRYRHDLDIIVIYKSDFVLMKREYLWVHNGCCPKLRPGKEYLIMGQKDNVRMGKERKNRSTMQINKRNKKRVDVKWRLETRLRLRRTNYWHPWKQKFSAGMEKLSKRMKCKNVKRRKKITGKTKFAYMTTKHI